MSNIYHVLTSCTIRVYRAYHFMPTVINKYKNAVRQLNLLIAAFDSISMTEPDSTNITVCLRSEMCKERAITVDFRSLFM